MNCREVNLVLDTKAPDDLTLSERQAIDRHLASCPTCDEEWANWRNIEALSIPPTPPDLRIRIAAMLPRQDATRERRPRRFVVIGGLLFAGAAVAAAIAMQLGRDAPGTLPALVESSQEPAELSADEPLSATAAESVDDDTVDADAPEAAEAAVDASSDIALDPFSIAVLARPEASAATEETAELANCHDAIVQQLQALGGLNVIYGATVSSFDGSGLSDREIARQLGAGNLLEVGTMNGCNARLWNTQTNERLTGSTYGGASVPPVNGWDGFATGIAMSVRDVTLVDPETIIAEAKATLLNTTLDDHQRVVALRHLRSAGKPMTEAYDSSVIAAATQIGMNSPDAEARVSAWVGLRGIDDPYLIQPLLQSLANDADEIVRMQAAVSLNGFLDEPGVRDALLQAAAADPSREPAMPCCIPTVREAAEWASIADADLPDWGRGTLLDESLPARSRLVPITMGYPDGRQLFLSQLGDDAPGAVFDIGRREQDPRVRQMAWGALAQSPRDDAFTAVLIDDLTTHPDEYVRSSAAMVLRRYADDPAVGAAFEQALDDSSMAVRRNAMSALERDDP